MDITDISILSNNETGKIKAIFLKANEKNICLCDFYNFNSFCMEFPFVKQNASNLKIYVCDILPIFQRSVSKDAIFKEIYITEEEIKTALLKLKYYENTNKK